MRINYNVAAMLSNNALANNDAKLANSLQRLSSGYKINRAKDNPSGLAMSKRMNAQIEGVNTANRNSADGVSVIETADGALTEVHEMLQRMNELAVKAGNDTMSDEDRKIIQEEVAQLKDEIARVSKTTQFNGQNLLDGTYAVKGYTNTPGMKVSDFGEGVPAGTYGIKSLKISDETDSTGKKTGQKLLDSITLTDSFPNGIETMEIKNNFLNIEGKNGFSMQFDLDNLPEGTYNGITVDIMEVGPMRLQVGANEGQVISVGIPDVSLRNMGIDKLDVSTKEGSLKGLDQIKGALAFVSDVRGKLGAYQNRLESTINSLDVTAENMTGAFSRIMDVDMAEEMTQYTTYQVLTQAGTSMLAQANERPSQVLQLLQ